MSANFISFMRSNQLLGISLNVSWVKVDSEKKILPRSKHHLNHSALRIKKENDLEFYYELVKT